MKETSEQFVYSVQDLFVQVLEKHNIDTDRVLPAIRIVTGKQG